MIESNKVKLTFIFKEADTPFSIARDLFKPKENKDDTPQKRKDEKEKIEKQNHDFLKKFRDHVIEKERLGTVSAINVERIFKEFYFEAE